MEKILITSALPYANGPLHFGHIAGAYLPGDCYARFQRLCGNDVVYICGSDEHGVAITLSADLANRTPKEHVDLFHAINKAFFEKLNFSFDQYGRTTWPEHADVTIDFFHALEKKGYIEKKTEQHLYSETEKRFLADRYVIGTCPKCGFQEARGDECQKCAASYEATDLISPKSKLTGSSLQKKPSEHLYLRFDLFKDQLKDWILKKNWKENVVSFAMSYIDDLKMRAITRDSDWGIPVPGYQDKVFYVWFDAPIGYVSITKQWAQKQGNPDLWKDYWLDPKTKLVQFIGKDNIPFHAVFFPAMLMGQDLPYKLPDEIPANEFFMLEGKQFSKSDNWTIDLEDFFKKFTTDQARYAIAANAPENADSEFSWKDFQMRCNAELLGKFGNFVRRVLVFATQHCEGQMPKSDPQPVDDEFLTKIYEKIDQAKEAYSHFHLRKVTQILMELAQIGNAYFEHKKPWALAKDPAQKVQLDTVIACCVECIKALALVACPIMPESAQKVWQDIGFNDLLEKSLWERVRGLKIPLGQKFPQPQILFRKIEDQEIMDEIQKLGHSQKELIVHPISDVALAPKIYEPQKSQITFDQFSMLDLRVGQVLEATKIPKSKKLLKLLVDLGYEKRTIVSGISLFYEPEALLGKKVAVVANLSPAMIMGIESHGMVLASSFENSLEVLEIQKLPPGSCIS